MTDKTMGEIISAQRKALGMTQSDLARQMGVTDKAVSKWERDLSCPDVASLGRLAQALDLSVEELLNAPKGGSPDHGKIEEIVDLALLGVGIAQGIALLVTSVLGQMGALSPYFAMAGIGMGCIALYLLRHKDEK